MFARRRGVEGFFLRGSSSFGAGGLYHSGQTISVFATGTFMPNHTASPHPSSAGTSYSINVYLL